MACHARGDESDSGELEEDWEDARCAANEEAEHPQRVLPPIKIRSVWSCGQNVGRAALTLERKQSRLFCGDSWLGKDWVWAQRGADGFVQKGRSATKFLAIDWHSWVIPQPSHAGQDTALLARHYHVWRGHHPRQSRAAHGCRIPYMGAAEQSQAFCFSWLERMPLWRGCSQSLCASSLWQVLPWALHAPQALRDYLSF